MQDEFFGEVEARQLLRRHQIAKDSQYYICGNPNIPEALSSYIVEKHGTSMVYSCDSNLGLCSGGSIVNAIEDIRGDLTEEQMNELGFDNKDLKELQEIAEIFDFLEF